MLGLCMFFLRMSSAILVNLSTAVSFRRIFSSSGRNLCSGYLNAEVFWNWVSVLDVFVELARDFSRLKGVLLTTHVTASIESILEVNTSRSAPGKPHAACSQKIDGGRLSSDQSNFSVPLTLDVQSLLTTTYHHATMNAFLLDFSLCFDDQLDACRLLP